MTHPECVAIRWRACRSFWRHLSFLRLVQLAEVNTLDLTWQIPTLAFPSTLIRQDFDLIFNKMKRLDGWLDEKAFLFFFFLHY